MKDKIVENIKARILSEYRKHKLMPPKGEWAKVAAAKIYSENIAQLYSAGKGVSKEGDWAAYNWLDEDGNDDWKIGRIVKVKNRLMYFNDDGTERSGHMPIYPGVRLLTHPTVSEGEIHNLANGYLTIEWDKENNCERPYFTMKGAAAIKELLNR